LSRWKIDEDRPLKKQKGGLLGPEGVGGYRNKCDEIAAKGYEGFALA
jgi:hypothetical protein